LAWNEDGSEMYSAEHGPSGNPQGYDEVNRIEAGANYGWPEIIGDEAKPGMKPPLFHSGEDTWAPSGMAYHNGTLYVAGLRGEQVRVFDPETGTHTALFQGEGRLRDVAVFDDRLYVLTNNGDGRGTSRTEDDRLLGISGF
jgi:glucose/arabinose dehydrogenase